MDKRETVNQFRERTAPYRVDYQFDNGEVAGDSPRYYMAKSSLHGALSTWLLRCRDDYGWPFWVSERQEDGSWEDITPRYEHGLPRRKS